MTEGISKEKIQNLIEYGITTGQLDSDIDLLKALLDLCAELDPWMTVDENTPKDKYILIFDYMVKSQVVAKFDDKIGMYLDRNRVAVYATHYKLLPEDPK